MANVRAGRRALLGVWLMTCHRCKRTATRKVVWADGRAMVPVCGAKAHADAIKSELRRRNGKWACIVGVRQLKPRKATRSRKARR